MLSKNTKLAGVFTLLYACLLAFFMQYHELWFDETEPWLLALYSDTYADLLYNKKFEGHPNLWYSLLFVVTRFTDNLNALKVTQWACAVAFIFVFLRKAPFSWAFKLLFCFGYYGLFEYGLISRLYAIELVTLFLICTFYPKRFTHWYGYIFLLVLNAQTNLFGFLISGVLGLLLFSEAFKLWKESPQWMPLPKGHQLAGIGLWGLGCLYSFWSMLRPVEPHREFFPFQKVYYVFQSATRIWQSFFTIPQSHVTFWNSSILKTSTEIPLSLLLLLFLVLAFYKNKRLLLPLLLLYSFLLLFFSFKFEGAIRHHAHYFFYALAFLWIKTFYPEEPSSAPSRGQRLLQWVDSLIPKLFLFFALAQFIGGAKALYVDCKYPFYPGKDAAEFLQSLPASYTITIEDDVTASTISAYLGKPLWHLPNGNHSTFFRLNLLEGHAPRKFVLFDWASAMAQQQKAPVIFISRFEIPYQWHATPVKFLKAFKGDYMNPYSFYVYEIPPYPLPKQQITAEPPVGGVEK
ncbi:hypothetical protein TH61_11365 [Rufibacter sp. DG15C]|uniref:hypothetical protein n=1 Tax=Rufibacter sp. DG15C TaxID=1379909 RepID=UPI00078D9471|nr:hypothetical protein [Rufibacter sp. DG15C]AMM51655.1 hypothetical protein TH61_11365 [Rufibacter sp. DG15C]